MAGPLLHCHPLTALERHELWAEASLVGESHGEAGPHRRYPTDQPVAPLASGQTAAA